MQYASVFVDFIYTASTKSLFQEQGAGVGDMADQINEKL